MRRSVPHFHAPRGNEEPSASAPSHLRCACGATILTLHARHVRRGRTPFNRRVAPGIPGHGLRSRVLKGAHLMWRYARFQIICVVGLGLALGALLSGCTGTSDSPADTMTIKIVSSLPRTGSAKA